LPPGDYGEASDSPPDEPAEAVNRLARSSAPTWLSRRPASPAHPDRQGAICTVMADRNPTAKRPRRTRAGIERTPSTIDGQDLSEEKRQPRPSASKWLRNAHGASAITGDSRETSRHSYGRLWPTRRGHPVPRRREGTPSGHEPASPIGTKLNGSPDAYVAPTNGFSRRLQIRDSSYARHTPGMACWQYWHLPLRRCTVPTVYPARSTTILWQLGQ